MDSISSKLTLEQISKDVHAFAKQCDDRAVDDLAFQAESRVTDTAIQATLERMEASLLTIHAKLNPEHEDYILRETNKKVDVLMELYDGVGFSVRALKYVSGALLSLSLLIGVLFAFIKYAAK